MRYPKKREKGSGHKRFDYSAKHKGRMISTLLAPQSVLYLLVASFEDYPNTISDYAMPNNSLHMEILTHDDLVNSPQLLKNIVTLVNGSYLEITMFNGQLRFENEQQLLSELGSDGLCATILEVPTNGDLKPVATACTTRCIKIENESNDTNDEVCVVTVFMNISRSASPWVSYGS